MNIHCDFMRDFESLVIGKECSLPQRQLLLCQAIIKCADISNPVRFSSSFHNIILTYMRRRVGHLASHITGRVL
jgi:hypothetical protein